MAKNNLKNLLIKIAIISLNPLFKKLSPHMPIKKEYSKSTNLISHINKPSKIYSNIFIEAPHIHYMMLICSVYKC